ncbi:MAG: hypothetical protein NVV59_08965 [Chitinophagaceae bacterium]|nr:hypothetical protein [Chitinophagaceae bacterium]
MASFINARVGFNKTWVDYLDFENECDEFDSDWSCDSLQRIVTLYFQNGGDTVSVANCNTAFTTYFNTQAGTTLTFSQIQSLFLQHCGELPNICAPVLNCGSFKNIIDSFYTRYGHNVSINVACDSLFADHFNGLMNTNYTFSQLQVLYSRTCGGIRCL